MGYKYMYIPRVDPGVTASDASPLDAPTNKKND